MASSTLNKSLNMINLNTNSDTKINTDTNINNIIKQTSLEEELIGSIQKQPDNIINTNNYHPVSCETHNASDI
jgi:hypothetical protein